MRMLSGIDKLVKKYPSKEEIIQYLYDKLDVNYIYERYDFMVDHTSVIIKDLDLIIENKELVKSLRDAHSLVLCFYSFNNATPDLRNIESAHQFFIQNTVAKFHAELKHNEEFDQLYIMSNCQVDSAFKSFLEKKLIKDLCMTVSGIKHAPLINYYQDSHLYRDASPQDRYISFKKGA